MDESMEEGDSLFSLPGPSDPRAVFHTPTQPGAQAHGLGLPPSIIPRHLPEVDESTEYPSMSHWTGNASPLAPDASASYIYEGAEEQVEEDHADGVGEEDESYADSETSSAQYDADADPEGFARRLDGLAGVMEVGEEEARALRWGPAIGRERDAPDLPLAEFRALIDHHLASTDWQYASPSLLLPSIPGRSSASNLPMGQDLLAETGDVHPIRVLGRGWTERDDQLEEPEGSPVGGGLYLNDSEYQPGMTTGL